MTELALLVPLIALAGGALACLGRTPAAADRLNVIAALATAVAALALAALALTGEGLRTRWRHRPAASACCWP